MGFVSSYVDNLDAKGESVRRSLCQRTKETEAVKAKSSCQPIKNLAESNGLKKIAHLHINLSINMREVLITLGKVVFLAYN